MRRIGVSLVVFVSASLCFVSASHTSVVQVHEMTPTVYDDGKACPGGCDAHVVFSAVHNGTRNAYDPASRRDAPRKCTPGQRCVVCFSAADSSCIEVTYRGAGPPVGKFDFTPAFFEENCGRADLPAPLAQICRAANPVVERLRTQHINCFENTEHPKCKEMMYEASRRKSADDFAYNECKRMGEAAFNRKFINSPSLQRHNDCQYEKLRRGLNPRTGVRWRLLLDGACRPGTYVGKSGLDCCTGNLYQAALLGNECALFFPSR